MENFPETPIVHSEGQTGVPVYFFLDEELMPGEEALRPLKELSRLPGVDEYLVALPDLHQNGRNIVPTGLVTVSRQHIIPFAVDKGINCGIRIMSLPLTATDLNSQQIDDFYHLVMQRVPVDKHPKAVLRKSEVLDILLQGAEWVVQRFGIDRDVLQNIERGGNMFREAPFATEEILRSIPRAALKKGRKRLGVLGGGNHFLELQQVVEVVDENLATRLQLQKDQLIIMLHSGTGGVGGSIMKYFHQMASRDGWEKKWEKIKFLSFRPWDAHRLKWFRRPHLYAIPANSPTARHFIRAVYAVANFGFANRMVISYQVEKALQEVLGDDSLRLHLLYDSSHVTIQQEKHNGGWFWVHRNGANQAMPASYLSEHPVYRETGQPIPIPGSMGTESYIAVAAEGARKTFCSTNHGAGRLLDKPEARQTFQENGVIATMQERGIRLFRYGKSPITDQAPDAFKDVGRVVQVMQKFHLANPVVKVRPLAVLKG